MPASSSERQPDRRAAYREYVDTEVAVRVFRVGTVCAVVMVLGFIPVDYFSFPEIWKPLAGVRVGAAAAMALLYVATPERASRKAFLGTATLMGLMLLVVTAASGGAQSPYYAGMILLFVAFPLLVPARPAEAAVVCAIPILAFLTMPLWLDAPTTLRIVGLHTVFLVSGGFVSTLSAHALETIRYADYLQRCELEEAERHLRSLDEVKTRFTANVHHELRTPLTLMLAPLETLRSGDYGALPDPVMKTLRTMHVNGRRLLKLINNLLDLAKLESNQFAVVRRPLDLRSVIEDVVEGSRPMAERKKIALETACAEGDLQLFADRDALEKVLINLVGNALKFTDAEGTIEVGAQRENDGFALWVRDTGVGLAPEQLGRIFDRFAQVDASATRKHEGTGIGLSLASELVELHEGRIWAESDGPGQGATMRVWLPVGRIDDELPEELLADDEGRGEKLAESMRAVESELRSEDGSAIDTQFLELERSVDRWQERQGDEGREAAAAGAADRARVIVADDNPDLRELLRFLLGREYQVRTATNGREALEFVREHPPHLVVTDIMMPEMSGTELCRTIKGDPELRDVPVMLVSSKAESEMKIEGLELGADDYVTKPFHPRELTARARGLVERRRLQIEVAARNEELQRALAELREAEVQLVQAEKLAAVGELAAGIAHEVNNPVNFALNSARALRSAVEEVSDEARRLTSAASGPAGEGVGDASSAPGISPAELADLADSMPELLDIVTEGLERTRRLVGDLKDFAAPGRQRTSDWDVRKSIAATLSLVGYELREHEVEVEVECEGTPPHLRADASALNQVFLNLIKNAAEAMEGGGGSIRVCIDWDEDHLRVAVADDGPGVSEEARGALFEPFFTTKEAGRGTGLGLSMSRQIAEAHGGSLDFESGPQAGLAGGPGTTFRLTLPLNEENTDGEG